LDSFLVGDSALDSNIFSVIGYSFDLASISFLIFSASVLISSNFASLSDNVFPHLEGFKKH